eukprot:80331_1
MAGEISSFYVMVTGQVESCKIEGCDTLYVKYGFNYGSDWRYLNGVETGISQIARKRSRGPLGSGGGGLVWNYPIDVTFSSTNPHGWPQIVLSVYGFNAFGRDVVRGYASTRLPTRPGRHTLLVRLYSPMSSSLCQQFIAWITGNPPEFFDSKFVTQGPGREVARVQSNGVVKIVVNVLTKNLSSFGFSVRDDRSKNPKRQEDSEPKKLK